VFKALLIGITALIVVVVGLWFRTLHRTEAALLEQPVYRVLKQHEPGVFADVLTEYRRYRRNEESHERFVNYANAKIGGTATRSLPRASQESVLALVRDMLGTAQKLQSVPDDACFRFWFPEVAGPPDVAKTLDPDSQARTLELMAEVIRSSSEQPRQPPDPESVKDDLARIVDDTYQLFGADAQMLANTSDPRADRTKVCAITNSIYERILRLPPPAASDLLRAMAPG
jgi:hypothetical protein